VQCGDRTISTATVQLTDNQSGVTSVVSKVGTGPVDAVYKAIGELTSEAASDMKLLEYTVSSVTAGIDALGEVTVRLQDMTNSRTGLGRSSNTDVIVASAKAYIKAINRLVDLRGIALPKHPQFSTALPQQPVGESA
jgi:2-isopropylmalate synthase